MSTTTDTDDTYLSPSVQRAVSLLRHIGEGDPVTNVSRTARALGINRTTLLRLLRTLQAERFIQSDPDHGGWRIGLGLIGLAAQAFFSQDLVQISVPVADRLAETLGLSAHPAVLDGRDVIFVVRRAPNAPWSAMSVPAPAAGTRDQSRPHHSRPPSAGAGRGAVSRQGDAGRGTKHSPVTLEQLRRRLDDDRALGIAWSDGNSSSRGSARSLRRSSMPPARPVAALNVSGRSGEFAEPRAAGRSPRRCGRRPMRFRAGSAGIRPSMASATLAGGEAKTCAARTTGAIG